MRYNPENIITHSDKLRMEILSPFMRNWIFCCEKEFKNGTFFHCWLGLRGLLVLVDIMYVEWCSSVISDENQSSSAHNIWVQTHSNKTTNKTPLAPAHNNRSKQLLLIKASSYLSIGQWCSSIDELSILSICYHWWYDISATKKYTKTWPLWFLSKNKVRLVKKY